MAAPIGLLKAAEFQIKYLHVYLLLTTLSSIVLVGFKQSQRIDGGSNWMILEIGQFGQVNSYHSCFSYEDWPNWYNIARNIKNG